LISVGRPCLTSAHRETTFEYGQDFEHLVLRVNAGALKRKLAGLTGAMPRDEIDFAPETFTSPAMSLGLQRLVETLASLLEDGDSQVSSLAFKELEQAIIVQFLAAGRHNFSFLLEKGPEDTTPHYVGLAEAYIDANWHRPVMIEDLVSVSGVSARSLFKAFRRWRGMTPMAFAKKVRLERSRNLLCSQDGASVTAVALACGFSNLGHFAREYRDMFGELPSQTVARSA
jgi:AraC-like DNA-binding protein